MTASTTETDTADFVAALPIGTWFAEVPVLSNLVPHRMDDRFPHTDRPLVIPSRHWAQVYGVDWLAVQGYMTQQPRVAPGHYASLTETWRVAAQQPFVVVYFRDGEGEHRRGARAAQQVNRDGEPGMFPSLGRKPYVLLSSLRDPDDNKRTLNWVRLSKIAEITGLDPVEIVRGFAGFSPSTIYEPNMPLLRWTSIVRVYTETMPAGFCGGETEWGGEDAKLLSEYAPEIAEDPRRFWIPQSLAFKILRLVRFGYRPDGELPRRSFRLEAPLPKAPEAPFPVLTTEEFENLEPLRMRRWMTGSDEATDAEVSEIAYRRIAERALGTDEWQDALVMDDGGSFRYHTGSQNLVAFGGRLVVSCWFWTRAGSPESGNYYAGQLAVFPEAVDDARRDQSAILRICIWPGSIAVETPTGRRHGLIPPNVPADIARVVERFLMELGYAD